MTRHPDIHKIESSFVARSDHRAGLPYSFGTYTNPLPNGPLLRNRLRSHKETGKNAGSQNAQTVA